MASPPLTPKVLSWAPGKMVPRGVGWGSWAGLVPGSGGLGEGMAAQEGFCSCRGGTSTGHPVLHPPWAALVSWAGSLEFLCLEDTFIGCHISWMIMVPEHFQPGSPISGLLCVAHAVRPGR